jgi:hypothetical protein
MEGLRQCLVLLDRFQFLRVGIQHQIFKHEQSYEFEVVLMELLIFMLNGDVLIDMF